MKSTFLIIAVIVAGVILFSVGCTKQNVEALTGSNNSLCSGDDTAIAKYNEDIVPIMQSICYNCHGNGNTAGSGGINLASYTNIKVYADNGDLIGNITHAPGHVPMPYGLPKLPDCEINKFISWVNNGTLNN
jgi:hypothetical protein